MAWIEPLSKYTTLYGIQEKMPMAWIEPLTKYFLCYHVLTNWVSRFTMLALIFIINISTVPSTSSSSFCYFSLSVFFYLQSSQSYLWSTNTGVTLLKLVRYIERWSGERKRERERAGRPRDRCGRVEKPPGRRRGRRRCVRGPSCSRRGCGPAATCGPGTWPASARMGGGEDPGSGWWIHGIPGIATSFWDFSEKNVLRWIKISY